MIQTLLLLSIVGLLVAQVWGVREPFEDISQDTQNLSEQPDLEEEDNDIPHPKPYNPVEALYLGKPLAEDIKFLSETSEVDEHGDDSLDLQMLQNPKPFHPMGGRGIPESPADANRKVATPYRDLKPTNQDDVETDDDPRDLPWIASWSAADRFARQGHNCAVKYVKEGRDGTSIITTSKSCEAGLPHTRAGGRIIIPDSIPGPLQEEIIKHELVHIYQRRYPEPWATFYRRNWSFVFHDDPPASMPESVREARRANPDTWTLPWPCWMDRIWPVPVYTNPKAPSLLEARTIWWDEWQHKILLEPPANWTAFFGNQKQDEHPHELSAVMIVAGDTMTEAGRRLMNWYRSEGALTRASRNSQD